MRLQDTRFEHIFDAASDLKLGHYLTRHDIPLEEEWKQYCRNIKGKYDDFITNACHIVDEARDLTTARAKNTIVNMHTEDFVFSLEMAYHIRIRAPSMHKMAALRIIAYMLIEINGRKESDWFMTVFYEYECTISALARQVHTRSHHEDLHGGCAEEWEKARRMLYNTVFCCLAKHGEMHGI
eukprot:5860292-Pleurochrysis_carterae.AAC.1